MPTPTCIGSPTFNTVRNTGYEFSEWPKNLKGLVCKTPPFGRESNPRFAQCCSGTLYNITGPTDPTHPAYPMSCAQVCLISPANGADNDRYPYHFSEHFMCLSDGGTADDRGDGGFVACATLGLPDSWPTSYPNTPSGSWQTRQYSPPPGQIQTTVTKSSTVFTYWTHDFFQGLETETSSPTAAASTPRTSPSSSAATTTPSSDGKLSSSPTTQAPGSSTAGAANAAQTTATTTSSASKTAAPWSISSIAKSGLVGMMLLSCWR
ncbi:hypothetical protein B0H63DRAFT_477290 [Podospora didyma]|uniref:Uncharacterized protein n=1 Tax=Podospora didyma TaxID=330526 RepID=A0AAE0KK39_9PEZI|nr:hypothetical protein B0H63DRAFT_477290 [Podospora didyma]